MAGTVNKVILIGNLGKDPEVRTLENGTKLARFSIATSETYSDKTTGEKRSITDWHNIAVWRNLAEITERYLKKGQKVYIEGKLKSRTWKDDAGNDKYTTEVVADNMTMLSSRIESTPQAPNFNTPDTPERPQGLNEDLLTNNEDDIIPF